MEASHFLQILANLRAKIRMNIPCLVLIKELLWNIILEFNLRECYKLFGFVFQFRFSMQFTMFICFCK